MRWSLTLYAMRISDTSEAVANGYGERVAGRIAEVRDRIAFAQARGGRGQAVTLVAVTKTHGIEAVASAWNAGVADVGENRVQEAEAKMGELSLPLRWHLIGHLQRNKARSAVRFSMVHGMDSERLAEALSAAAIVAGSTLDVLVQVNVSGESTKSGFRPGDIASVADRLHSFTGIRVRGAMTMAPFDAPESVLRSVFAGTRQAQLQLKHAGHPADLLSMGMSGDYEIAIEEGATHVRLGTVLFGDRS